MDHVYAAVTLGGFISLVIGVPLLLCAWGGKCKRCGSWNNWKQEPYVTGAGSIFETIFDHTSCSACGHSEVRASVRRKSD
jgi:hypothetical protein